MPLEVLRASSSLAETSDVDGYGPADLMQDVGFTDTHIADLEEFRALLSAANESINLVGPSALSVFWRRHVLDSAQLLALAPDAKRWADLGAGAGFPGLVLAVGLKGSQGVHVDLIESQAKRCRFLQGVIDALALPATVHWARAETLERAPPVDIVTARACAPLARLFGYALPFMKTGARGLFLKGRTVEAEIIEARKSWRFAAATLQSRSDPSGRIVRVEGLHRG